MGADSEWESSFDGEPIAVLIGHGNIIPGLESALKGRVAGDTFEVVIAAADAYGDRQEGAIQRIAKKHFPPGTPLRAGAQTRIMTRFGARVVTVRKVGLTTVDVDLNHPLAGQSLAFRIQIVEVRAATDEEIAHRHAHGAGGQAHG